MANTVEIVEQVTTVTVEENNVTVSVTEPITTVIVGGTPGPQGATGAAGAAGIGIPQGGSTGQVLAKIDATDYNTEWVTSTAGGITVSVINDESVGGISTLKLKSQSDLTVNAPLDLVDEGSGNVRIDGIGDVTRSGATTADHSIARFDGVTGHVIQGGTNAPTYDDTGAVTIASGGLQVTGTTLLIGGVTMSTDLDVGNLTLGSNGAHGLVTGKDSGDHVYIQGNGAGQVHLDTTTFSDVLNFTGVLNSGLTLAGIISGLEGGITNMSEGTLYYQTDTDLLRVYDGSSWSTVGASATTAIDDLTDVTITSVATGEVLKYDGADWVNNTLAEAGIAAASHSHTQSDISDVSSTASEIDYLSGSTVGNGRIVYGDGTKFTGEDAFTFTTAGNTLQVGHSSEAGDIWAHGALQVGLTTKVQIKNSSGELQVRNNADSAYADVRLKDLYVEGTVNFDTDAISEGATNLYFTNERVDDQVNTLLTDGSGISSTYDDGAGTLTVNVDITNEADTVIAASDEILFADTSDSNNIKKDTVQGILDLASGTTYTASEGVQIAVGDDIQLDINGLTEVGQVSTGDFVAIYDASVGGGSHTKIAADAFVGASRASLNEGDVLFYDSSTDNKENAESNFNYDKASNKLYLSESATVDIAGQFNIEAEDVNDGVNVVGQAGYASKYFIAKNSSLVEQFGVDSDGSIYSAGKASIGTTDTDFNFQVSSGSAQQANPAFNILETSHVSSRRATMGFGVNAGITEGFILGQDWAGIDANTFYLFNAVSAATSLYVDGSTGYVQVGGGGGNATNPLSIHTTLSSDFVTKIQNNHTSGDALLINTAGTSGSQSSLRVSNNSVINFDIHNDGDISIGHAANTHAKVEITADADTIDAAGHDWAIPLELKVDYARGGMDISGQAAGGTDLYISMRDSDDIDNASYFWMGLDTNGSVAPAGTNGIVSSKGGTGTTNDLILTAKDNSLSDVPQVTLKANTAFVGINKLIPTVALDVVGAGAFTGDVTVPTETYGISWSGSAETPTKGDLYTKIETLGGGVSFGSDNEIPYTNSGGTDFDYISTFNFDGSDLGLGTTTPNYMFHMNESTASTGIWMQMTNVASGTTSADGMFFGLNASGGSEIYGKGGLDLYGNSTKAIDIDTSGNVGIGRTPSYKLDVTGQVRIVDTGAGYTTPYNLSLQSNDATAWFEILNNGGAGKGAFFGMTSNDFEQWNYQGGDIVFYTGAVASTGTERLRILSTGDINLGGDLHGNGNRMSFDHHDGIIDDSDNEFLIFHKNTSAVNYFEMANAVTGSGPIFYAEGSDTNVDLILQAKGTGSYKLNGTATASAALDFYEDTTTGTNFISVVAPSSIISNSVLTLPEATDTLVGKATTDTFTNKSGNISMWTNDAGYLTSVADNYLLNTGDTGTGAYDFGGADSFEIPNSTTETLTANGQIGIDTLVTGWSRGLMKFYQAEEHGLVAMPIAYFSGLSNGDYITYDDSNQEWTVSAAPVTGDADQNLWLTVAGDTGSTAANVINDTLTVAGGTGITTAMSGDTLTITATGGGGGEANTASNVGTAGVGVFKQKTGIDLELKNINAGSSKVTITDDTGNNEIDIDVVEANIDHDSLSGFVANEHIDWTQASAGTIHATNYSDTNTQLSQEQVEDFAGALIANGTGTHTGITVTYQDATGDIDLVVDHDAASNYVAGEHFLQSAITTVGTVTTGNVDAVVSAASTTTAGKVELATIAEVDTGTDTTRAVTADALHGSTRNLRYFTFDLFGPTTSVTTGTVLHTRFSAPYDGVFVQSDSDKDYFMAQTETAGTSGTMVIDVHLAGSTIMSSNKLDIESGERDTTTATTQPDLTTTSFSKGQEIVIQVDSIHSTPAQGLTVRLAHRPN